MEFHFAVYKCCGMPYLLSTIETLRLRIGPSFSRLIPGIRNSEVWRTQYGYRRLRQAIRARAD
ncbi:FCD domain-containing protein [Mesorhizobium sp.]|uniref:FCD domain-containing protein n=1 Tax=Mesorhizobium sp. TaxID=1871066 RepID=UPI00343C0B78